MCGRFTLNTTGEAIAAQFDVDSVLDPRPRYNIAPTDEASVVREPDAGDRELSELRWGLVPFWADDPSIGNKMINARAETAPDKPAFRDAFRKRRCIVPASGFYEWAETDDGKQPYWVHPSEDELWGFAGLWERWSDEQTGEILETFAILTGEPNDAVAQLHDRMPVILQRESYDVWLRPGDTDPDSVWELAQRTYPSSKVAAHPVSTRVNNPRFDEPSAIEPLDT
ncbi:MAG: SOS response-associated peptidase [Bradymonadaceae bacterium]